VIFAHVAFVISPPLLEQLVRQGFDMCQPPLVNAIGKRDNRRLTIDKRSLPVAMERGDWR
jgi:hypothetical protein